VLAGHAITATRGHRQVREVEVRRLRDGQVEGSADRILCDAVAVSGGWNPTIHLQSQARARPHYDEAHAIFLPGTAVQAERSAGACNGAFTLAACFWEGAKAGVEAAAAAGFAAQVPELPAIEEAAEQPVQPVWQLPGKGKAFVDLQNDVTAADIGLALREGYRSVEHVKRYTTTGMGTDQGKTSNVNALGIIAKTTGQSIPEIGVTTFRPPYTPVTFGAIVGRNCGALFDPVRRTPMHAWHEAQGAVFEDVGQWKRPWYYPRPGETMADAVDREVRVARSGVVILDAARSARSTCRAATSRSS
jgi:sarcosine oxidase subunit alpha